MVKKILRAALYIRVSSSEQAMYGYSLPSQISFLTQYAENHGMVVVGVYADQGKSARKQLKKRKQIHVLLHDIECNKIDIVVFWKMDRWFRNIADFYKVQEVLDAHGVRWIAAAEESCNMETREGRLNVNIHLSIGQNESDTTSERIKFTRGTMIKEGRAIFGDASLIFGYKMMRTEEGKKIVVKDPDLSPVVYDMIEHLRTYKNKRQALFYVRDKYNVYLTPRMLTSFLKSDLPCGSYKDNSNYCEPYFTKEDWLSIQTLFNHGVKSSSSGRVYLFTSLIKCPCCGNTLAGTWSPSRSGNVPDGYLYYRCNPSQYSGCSFISRVSERKIESYLLQSLDYELEQFILRLDEVDSKPKVIKKSRSEGDIKKELDRLNYMFQKGRIGFDAYEKEFERLSLELPSIAPVIIENKKDYSDLHKIIEDFTNIYSDLERPEKKAFWHSIISEIKIDDARNVTGVEFM